MATPPSDTCETEQPLDDVLEAVAAGDRAAFRRLYDTSVPVLHAICLRLMRNQDLARDTLQEALTKIWLKAHLFDRSKGKAMAWMAIVTRNSALSRLAAHAPPMAAHGPLSTRKARSRRSTRDPATMRHPPSMSGNASKSSMQDTDKIQKGRYLDLLS